MPGFVAFKSTFHCPSTHEKAPMQATTHRMRAKSGTLAPDASVRVVVVTLWVVRIPRGCARGQKRHGTAAFAPGAPRVELGALVAR